MTTVNLELDSLSDDALMLRYQEGNDLAFNLLDERWRARLQDFFVRRHGFDSDTADDLAQEVFIRLLRHRDLYESKDYFENWLITIANRLAISEHRNRLRVDFVHLDTVKTEFGEGSLEPVLVDDKAQTDYRLEALELHEAVLWALPKLSKSYQQIIVLRAFKGLSYPEIAKLLGRPVTTIRIRLHHARAHLRMLVRDRLRMRRVA